MWEEHGTCRPRLYRNRRNQPGSLGGRREKCKSDSLTRDCLRVPGRCFRTATRWLDGFIIRIPNHEIGINDASFSYAREELEDSIAVVVTQLTLSERSYCQVQMDANILMHINHTPTVFFTSCSSPPLRRLSPCRQPHLPFPSPLPLPHVLYPSPRPSSFRRSL